MPYDVLIRAADRDIAIADGVFAGFELTPREEIDAQGLTVLPGVIGAHVHFNEPGRTDWEGWATGTAALAAGGTACVEMPLNAHPPTIDGPAFDAKVAAARASAVVDFALWGGLVPDSLDRLPELAERGVVGFKAFMCDSGIADFPAVDEDVLGAGMARARLDLPVAVHAEDPASPCSGGHRLARLRRLAPGRGRAARDRDGDQAGARDRLLAARGPRQHRARGRSRGAVRRHVRDLPALPHVDRGRPRDARHARQVRPAARTAAERDALRERLGDLAFIASDHSPCPPDMKRGDFTAAWGGIAGCQTLLPILLDLGVDDVVRLTSRGPAERLRLQGRHRARRRRRPRPGGPGGSPRARAARPPSPEPVRRPGAARPRRSHAGPRHDRVPRRPDRRRAARAPADTDQGRPCMSDLRITAGPFEFGADWVADAPKTRAAFEAMLPFRNKIIHVRWSGESAWIPLGDLETNLSFETTRATRRRARSCSTRAASAKPRSCSPTAGPASRASSDSWPGTTSSRSPKAARTCANWGARCCGRAPRTWCSRRNLHTARCASRS